MHPSLLAQRDAWHQEGTDGKGKEDSEQRAKNTADLTPPTLPPGQKIDFCQPHPIYNELNLCAQLSFPTCKQMRTLI